MPEPVKAERLERLQAAINRRQAAFLDSRAGQTAEVLFERRGRHPGQLVGRSPWLIPVHVAADDALLIHIERAIDLDLQRLRALARAAPRAPGRSAGSSFSAAMDSANACSVWAIATLVARGSSNRSLTSTG